eukprot:TRINITY_DN87363_c0_g1_i1.p1 TRINITY_DN87363_c0_g1~~TRINITY_DN87363_c0_g1_i1.p1  ORF type:complete len:141 (+),score=1.65 TRINITY_DN87363_c0_g1_i1:66-488(+)
MGIIKSGKVVVLLAGRYAGRKAVVMSASEEGNGNRKFGHAVVAGIDRYPRKVTRAMGKKRLDKRCKVKPFVKAVNFVHLMPTRYSVDMELKKLADGATAKETRVETRKNIKKIFEERYKSQNKTDKKAAGVQYFFNKLRF